MRWQNDCGIEKQERIVLIVAHLCRSLRYQSWAMLMRECRVSDERADDSSAQSLETASFNPHQADDKSVAAA